MALYVYSFSVYLFKCHFYCASPCAIAFSARYCFTISVCLSVCHAVVLYLNEGTYGQTSKLMTPSWQPRCVIGVVYFQCLMQLCLVFYRVLHVIMYFYRATLCLSAVLAMALCPSVCPSVWLSVTFVHSIQTAEDIVKLSLFVGPVAHHSSFLTPGADTQFQREPL